MTSFERRIFLESLAVGGMRFREEHVYDNLAWEYGDTLSGLEVHIAPCGGAIAIRKDPSSILIIGEERSIMKTYTAYG
ncbi:MAG: hypothetical protein EZS28_050890, partial [Streblomastix strix]